MPWAKFDDRFPSNRKVRLLSDRAFRLYVSAICWSAENLTDGFVAETELRLVADIRGAKTAAGELVDAGLWVPSLRVRAAVASSSRRVGVANSSPSRRGRVEVGDASGDTKVRGWEIHDYHEYNPTAEQVRAEREAKTARQQRWRDKHKGTAPDREPSGRDIEVDASTDASRNASRDGAGDAAPRTRVPDPTRPVPYPSLSVPTDPTCPTPVAEPTDERETNNHADTDRPASFAEQTIRAANVVAPSQEADFLTWITDTHKPRGTGWWKTVAANGDLPNLAADWRTQHAPRAAPTPLPAWCGDCGDGIPLARTNADLRQTEDSRGIRRPCPTCHPTAHRKAS